VTRFVHRLERRRLLAITVFTVDPTQTAVTLDGHAQGFDFKRQDDGSLHARYDGAIVADYVPGTSIHFLGGSRVAAEMRGRFDPGNAPGNYAAEVKQFGVTVFEGVLRNLQLDLFSDTLPVASGSFSSAGERARATAGRFSYSSPFDDGGFDLAGQEAVNKTTTASTVVTGADGVTRLTIPIDVTYTHSDPDAEIHLTGQIVATAGADNGLRPRVDANGDGFGTASQATFTTGGPPVAAVATGTDGLTVADFDSSSLASATATLLARPDGAAETLAVDTTGTGLAAAYDASTGVLTLTGSAAPSVYQQVLRTLTYADTSATPTLGDRTVRITASDATGPGPAADAVVSVEEPFNVNAVRIGDGENRSVTFADADGTVSTVTLTGGGSATVRFSGAEKQTKRRRGDVLVSGADVRLVRIEATGTTPLTRVGIRTAGGNGTVDLGGATADGPLASFGGRGVNATGTLDFNGRVAAATFRDVSAAILTAPGITRLIVGGSVAGSTITLEEPFNPALPALGSLLVRGAISNSKISTAGSIGVVKASGLIDSGVFAGTTGTDPFPSTAAGYVADATIRSVTLKSATAATFQNSVVAARHLGRINLGGVTTSNGGTPFGLASDTIAFLAATAPTGQKVKLTKLDDPAALAARLATVDFPFGDFQIRLVLRRSRSRR
jgi:hypothetical protein